MLFLKKKEFSSCSSREICKFQKNEDKMRTLTPFLYSYRIGSVHCGLIGMDSIGLNDGGCYGLE